MSDPQSIPKGLPDPFLVHPTKAVVPLSGIEHVSQSQTLNLPAVDLTLSPQQLLSPLILNYTESTGTYSVALPAALPLFNTFGSVNQVQDGDVFEVDVIRLLSTSGGSDTTFNAGSGGSGSVAVSAYAPNRDGHLHIQFSVTLSPFSVSYSLF